jgi:hypothetical protein
LGTFQIQTTAEFKYYSPSNGEPSTLFNRIDSSRLSFRKTTASTGEDRLVGRALVAGPESGQSVRIERKQIPEKSRE